MTVIVPAVRRVPLIHASDGLIDACVQAAAEDPRVFTDASRASLVDDVRHHRAAMKGGTAPHTRDLIIGPAGDPAGWVGWVPYEGPIEAWESTTYLAPTLRGTGMLTVARCWQVHMSEELRAWGGDGLVLLSSIAPTNGRSLAASRRYADSHGWPANWLSVDEPAKGRTSHVLLWPQANPIPHTCIATNAVS